MKTLSTNNLYPTSYLKVMNLCETVYQWRFRPWTGPPLVRGFNRKLQLCITTVSSHHPAVAHYHCGSKATDGDTTVMSFSSIYSDYFNRDLIIVSKYMVTLKVHCTTVMRKLFLDWETATSVIYTNKIKTFSMKSGAYKIYIECRGGQSLKFFSCYLY